MTVGAVLPNLDCTFYNPFTTLDRIGLFMKYLDTVAFRPWFKYV